MKALNKILLILIVLTGSMVCKANEEEKALEYFNTTKERYEKISDPTRMDSAYMVMCERLDYNTLDNEVSRLISPDNPSLKNLSQNGIFTLDAGETELVSFLYVCCGLNLTFYNRGYFFAPDLAYLKLWYDHNRKYITRDQVNAYRKYQAVALVYYQQQWKWDWYLMTDYRMAGLSSGDFDFDTDFDDIDTEITNGITLIRNDFFKRVYADYYRELDERSE